ncbi:MAG: 50S ribosomal protein L9, partial [Acholeplasmatales bacterium]|nr:50S ribosomal protein L9 [Acholeplasmatales bacterium]
EKKALQIIDEDSLLIIVDTQNKAIVLGPTLLEHATNVIVVDHHRSDMDAIKGKINLIDTNSSSVIELLTGLLPYIDVNITYTDLEANILYSAIIIDTQNLINKTSSNTFDALKYLIQNGSDTQVVKQWLRRDLEEINKFNGFISEAIRFEEKFLFILSNEILTSVEVSQLCDLGLEVQGIMASFAISKINETEVKVSARSLKSVNVQSILETLNLSGGGHFTAAALVTKEYSVSELFNMIKEEINKEFQEGDKNVKVILIEDIKDKGKADEIIEVKPGYAQFLISGKKAILATKDNVKELEEKQESIKKASEQIYKTMLLAKESIEGKTVVIKMQVGADLKIFGAVTSGKIAEAFNVQHNILLDKKKISIESDINSLGIYQASIALYKDIKANFHIEVLAENV